MEARVKMALNAAQRALASLEEVLSQDVNVPIVRDAAIKRFEYTFEATSKAACHILLKVEGVDAASPKGVARTCLSVGILTQEECTRALDMADDRNLTTHTYNESFAKEMLTHLEGHDALALD